MRPRLRSYGDSSTRTLSPGTTRMKFIRIFPEMCARTAWPFWSSTLNIALGRASETVPSTSITSLDGLLLAMDSRHRGLRGVCPRELKLYRNRPSGATGAHAATAAWPSGAVRTTGPAAVHHRVCSEWADRLPSAVTTVHWAAKVL